METWCREMAFDVLSPTVDSRVRGGQKVEIINAERWFGADRSPATNQCGQSPGVYISEFPCS